MGLFGSFISFASVKTFPSFVGLLQPPFPPGFDREFKGEDELYSQTTRVILSPNMGTHRLRCKYDCNGTKKGLRIQAFCVDNPNPNPNIAVSFLTFPRAPRRLLETLEEPPSRRLMTSP